MTSKTKWGVCGAGLISGAFANALNNLLKDGHELTAISASTASKAEQFASKYKVKKAYGSYIDLAKDKEVEVVYIGVIHPGHFDLCKMMMEHGKHVLCEKPLTMNSRQAEQLINLARNKHVFFMEAMWSRFFPVYEKIRSEIAAGAIGTPMNVQASFVVKLDHVPRVTEKRLGGGVLLDIGVYAVQFATMIFAEDPVEVQAMGSVNADGVDMSDSIQIKFSGDRYAQLYLDGRYNGSTAARVFGTEGCIEIPRYIWCPTQVTTPSGSFDFSLPGKSENFTNDQGIYYQLESVRQCINAGQTECVIMPLDDTLRVARIMDEVRKQTGVVYEEDWQ